MGVHKNSIQFPTGSASVKDTATGFSSGFGRQTNTVFGTFPSQIKPQQNASSNSAAFGSQHSFGNNSFNNTGFYQPFNFGFGRTMSQQTTNICFTGFGEHKTKYCFSNSSNANMKKVTLVFEHPDIIFGSSIFGKPNTIVEIEAHPINNRILMNNNDFTFSVGRIEKYNSTFIMKSATPIKFLLRVKQPGFSFNNTMSSSMNYGNRKITLNFQSDKPQYIPNTNILRPTETIVEIPLPLIKYDPILTSSNEDFMFFVGPTGATNSFEVQTSKNAVFKVTFAEKGNYNNNLLFGNRETRTGSVFFDQGRQMNAFPSTSGSLFGTQAPCAFGANQSFGNSTTTTRNNGLASNQNQPTNSNQSINGPLFGKPSVSYGFGANQAFGNSTIGTAGIAKQKIDNSSPNKGGFLFGQTNNVIDAEDKEQPVFGQLFGNSKPENDVVFRDQGMINSNEASNGSSCSEAFGFAENQSLFPVPDNNVKKNLTSVHYQPTYDTDALGYPVKTNCITAMREYTNTSLEELRVQDYLRTSCEPAEENNITTNPGNETANTNTKNNFTGFIPSSQNEIGNTNQAFFEQLHQLIPYLNAGSFCKCVRSCNAAKNRNDTSLALANSQTRTNDDSLDHLYVKTQKPRLNENITIDEFYEDVFKYLEYIQKQYRHLESTLNNKNATNTPDKHLNQSAANKADEESNKTSNQNNTPKTPIPVFGCSTYSAVNAASSLNENNSPVNPGSENDVLAVEKVTSNFNNVEPKKSLLFGTVVGNKISVSTSKPLEASPETKQNFSEVSFPIPNTSGSCDVAVKTNETSKTEDNSTKSATLKPEEPNRNSTQNTQTYPMSLFGSTYSAVNTSSSSNPGSESNSSTVAKGSNLLFGSSAFASTGAAVSFFSTIAENSKKDNKVEPTKSLLSSKPFESPFFITSGKTDDAIKMKETNNTLDDDKSNGIRSSSTEEKSTGFFSSTLPSSKPDKFFPGFIFSTKDNTSSSSLGGEKSTSPFSTTSKMPEKTLTAPIFSTKDTNSSTTDGKNSIGPFSFAVPNTFTTPNFSNKDTFSSSTMGRKATNSLVQRQIQDKTVKAPFFSSIHRKFSCTVDEKNSKGFFSFEIPNYKPHDFTAPFLAATKDTISSSTKDDNLKEIESNANKINVTDLDVDESKVNNSSTKDNFKNESDNGSSPSGGINIVKAVNSLKSIISNDNIKQGGSSEEKIHPTHQLDEPMHEEDCSALAQPFKMRKISDIIADINEGEENRNDSSYKSDSDSDISNYSLITNRSLNEDGKKNASYIQTEEHPTGIVITRYGYYILPSLDDLKSQITPDGACVVPNFTIGRKGYGSVCFNKEINVAGLNVNDIVHFRNKEIIIFPNENIIKPELVADLKKCDVLVTLEQVWPHDETKHRMIRDPQKLDKIKYEDKLRLVCHKNNVHFIDYRPETGSWLFKMKQFTKNNINCWDVEDEDDEIVENKSSAGIPKIIKFKQSEKTEEQGPPAKKISF